MIKSIYPIKNKKSFMSTETLEKLFEKRSLNEKLKILVLSKKEQIQMQNEIIEDTKPFFEEYSKVKSDSNDDFSIFIELYDERIRTLPKELLFDIQKYLTLYKDAEDIDNKKFYLTTLLNAIELSYSIDGWYRNKLVESIKNN